MGKKILQVNHLSKSFGANVVLRDIDFTVSTGDVTTIIGASGSGKSTLLRCINLLETPTSGEILFHDKAVTGKGVKASAYRTKHQSDDHGIFFKQGLCVHYLLHSLTDYFLSDFRIAAMIFSWVASLAGISATMSPSFMT